MYSQRFFCLLTCNSFKQFAIHRYSLISRSLFQSFSAFFYSDLIQPAPSCVSTYGNNFAPYLVCLQVYREKVSSGLRAQSHRCRTRSVFIPLCSPLFFIFFNHSSCLDASMCQRFSWFPIITYYSKLKIYPLSSL